jgi:hypothetical protein
VSNPAVSTVPLTPLQQEEFLHLLARGASPAVACTQLGVMLTVVLDQFRTDNLFRQRFEEVQNLLSQNVAAALYRSAMEGSVSAQTFFLKNRPPQEWNLDADTQPAPAETTSDGLDELTITELLQIMQDEEIPVPE